MSDEERFEEKKFKVTDRRQFTEQGELRQDPPAPREEWPTQTPPASSEGPQGKARADAKIDFSSFLLSLAGSAMMHLGEAPGTSGPQSPEDLEAARQMIEIVSMLQAKTKGNLSAEESQLLDQLLYELQMAYVNKTKLR